MTNLFAELELKLLNFERKNRKAKECIEGSN